MGHGKFDGRVVLGTLVRASTVITGWNTISQLVVKETPLMQVFVLKRLRLLNLAYCACRGRIHVLIGSGLSTRQRVFSAVLAEISFASSIAVLTASETATRIDEI